MINQDLHGHKLTITSFDDCGGEIDLWFQVADEEEEVWAQITLEFEPTSATDAIFAELGECA